MESSQIQPEKSRLLKYIDVVVVAIATMLAFFHLYTATIGIMPGYAQSAIHWAFVGSYILLTRPLKFKYGWVIDLALIAANLYLSWHQIVLQEEFVMTAGIYTKFDVYVSVAAVIIAIEIARRVIGLILPVIAVLFALYALYGSNLTGVFKTVRFSMTRLAPYLYTASDGLYGQTLFVSAQFIFLFILFGTILDLTGAGNSFVNMSFSLFGRSRGGPAQAAVYSSMLMGTINGSGAANVVTTGMFTIPLMKKVGYKPSMAGAIEAVASSGGQIMPPVMGAVAFLMSEVTGIPYSHIAIAALVPAVLYYITLSISVYVTARKQNIPAVPKEEMLDPVAVFKDGWIYFLPLVMLVSMLMYGYSPQKSAFYAIIATVVVGFVKNRKNMTIKAFLEAFGSAAAGIAPIAAACILAGVVMGVINMTGLGLKISGIIENLAAGRLVVALVLAMITSLVLGMGLPTSAAYMILAVLVAPAVVKMGATPMASHMFILYFGALSTITPPVALSTFAAAGIAKAGIWATGLDAMKLASAGFIIPFIFVFNTELLLMGDPLDIVFAIVTACIGCCVLAVALFGWCVTNISPVGRLLLLPCAIALILPRPMWANFAGAACTAAVIMLEVAYHRRKAASAVKA